VTKEEYAQCLAEHEAKEREKLRQRAEEGGISGAYSWAKLWWTDKVKEKEARNARCIAWRQEQSKVAPTPENPLPGLVQPEECTEMDTEAVLLTLAGGAPKGSGGLRVRDPKALRLNDPTRPTTPSPAVEGSPYHPDVAAKRAAGSAERSAQVLDEELTKRGVPRVGSGSGERVPPPKDLLAFSDAERVKPKTPVQGGGGLRKRWKDSEGNIYEWDSQHGTVEKYDPSGQRHLGEFDPKTGQQTKPPDPSRKIEK
jgi:hypothetical protein